MDGHSTTGRPRTASFLLSRCRNCVKSRGFLGSHFDISGSFAQDDLSKVALVCMVDQAKAAGVSMTALRAEDQTIIANPVIHDKSLNLLNGAANGWPTANSEDRTVRYADGRTVRQRQMNKASLP